MNEFKADAQTMNALVDALGCIVVAVTRRMPPEHRAAFADDLARLAANAEKNGNTTLETLLIDLQRMAR